MTVKTQSKKLTTVKKKREEKAESKVPKKRGRKRDDAKYIEESKKKILEIEIKYQTARSNGSSKQEKEKLRNLISA